MTISERTACIGCRRETAGQGACRACVDRARFRLRELHALVLLLRRVPSLRAQQMTVQEGRGSGSPGSVLNLEVADLIGRHGVQAVMLEWCAYVSDARRVTGVQSPSSGTRDGRKSLWDASLSFLDAHLDWLAAQGDIWNDFMSEVTTPWSKLRQIVYGDRRPPKPVPCPALDCDGTIRLRPDGTAECRHDPTHAWTYDEWSRLALLVAQETAP